MIKYVLLLTFLAQAIWAKPVPPVGVGDLGSHIVIVTPQAQVHLDSAFKYGSPATIVHHLSPLARFAAPQDETIVYVPASGSQQVIAVPQIAPVSVVGRSGTPEQPILQKVGGGETKQYEMVIQQIQQAGMDFQNQVGMYGPQFSEAAQAAAAAASSAGSSFFPGGSFFPGSSSSASGSGGGATATATIKDDKLKNEKTDFETPASTQILAPAEPRRFYAVAPALPHLVDFVPGPLFVGPLSAVRARSIQEGEFAKPAAPELEQKEEQPLKSQLPLIEEKLKEDKAELEKKAEFSRFLEANALKEELKEEKFQQAEELKSEIKEEIKKELLKNEEDLPAFNSLAEQKPQLKAVIVGPEVVQEVVPAVETDVVPQVIAAEVVQEAFPQEKVV